MKSITKSALTGAIALALSTGAVVVGGATFQSASAACNTAILLVAQQGNSTSGQANSGCTGLTANNTYDGSTIKVKGQFKDGSWWDSNLTAKWVTPSFGGQVVGETVNGRLVRGRQVEGASYGYVWFTY